MTIRWGRGELDVAGVDTADEFPAVKEAELEPQRPVIPHHGRRFIRQLEGGETNHEMNVKKTLNIID